MKLHKLILQLFAIKDQLQNFVKKNNIEIKLRISLYYSDWEILSASNFRWSLWKKIQNKSWNYHLVFL